MTATLIEFPGTKAHRDRPVVPLRDDPDARCLSPAFAVGGIESPSRVQSVSPVVSIPADRRLVTCANWDSLKPQSLYDSHGRCIGTLQPRATLAQLGHGIQGHSRPETDTRLD